LELKECECGCGELIAPINTKGNISRFVIGHNFKGKSNPKWLGGEYINNKGYIKILVPDHPYRDSHGHVLKHRWIYEQYLGRYLRPEEHIHHKDNNKLNNDLSNLELTDRSKHSKITASTNPKCQKIDMSGRICLVCKSDKTNPSSSNGQPHWMKHPITKEKWTCEKCYRRIKRNKSN
jgi:hypothetical protein